MKKYPSVYIIILNWNGYKDTLECMKSLSRIEYKNHKVVVVDNGSSTNEIDCLKEKFPEVEIIKSKENLGFSGGNNLGIEYSIKSGADFILLLNNDTIVEPDFLTHLILGISRDERIGITVPKINFYSKPHMVWYAGGFISKFRSSGYTIGEGELENKFFEEQFVSFATGCCMLINKHVIHQMGLMDEKYFLYLEDADYCVRNIMAGYKILFLPQSKIYHKVNASSTRNNSLLPLYYGTRNRLYFAEKFYNKYFYITFVMVMSIFAVKSCYWILIGERKKIKIVRKAIKDFIDRKMGKNEDI